LASVTWSIQYSGVKTDFFVYKPTRGGGEARKEVKPGMSMLSVDATKSENKTVNLRLTDGHEDEVVICCDVKVLRDDGYGSMTTKQKEKCSAPIRVEDPAKHSRVEITADVPESGSVGTTVPIVCNVRNRAHGSGYIKLMVNGRTLREESDNTLQYSLPLQHYHFASSSTRYGQEEAVVSCLVKDQWGSTIANATRIIRKEESETLAPITSWEPPQSGNISRGPRNLVPSHSYIILEETYSGGSRVLGRIVDSVIERIPNPSRTAANILETSAAPFELLDILGFTGHRVVGVSSKNNRMVWTLEREHVHMRGL